MVTAGAEAEDVPSSEVASADTSGSRRGSRGWIRLQENDSDGDGKISKDETPENIKRFLTAWTRVKTDLSKSLKWVAAAVAENAAVVRHPSLGVERTGYNDRRAA